MQLPPRPPSHARRGIIPETPLDFHDCAYLLVRTLSEDRFYCFMQENCLDLAAGFLSKVFFLLPQGTNIAREQMVVACRELLVLKMPRVLLEASFKNALNFNDIFCLNI